MIDVPNAINGLPLVPCPWPHVCYFQSVHGAQPKSGCFDSQALPVGMVLDMLRGTEFRIVDGTTDGKMPCAFLRGVLTWAYCWEIARLGAAEMVRSRMPNVALASAPECVCVALSGCHERTIKMLKKMALVAGRFPALRVDINCDPQHEVVFLPSLQDGDSFITLYLRWDQVNYDDRYAEVTRLIWGKEAGK